MALDKKGAKLALGYDSDEPEPEKEDVESDVAESDTDDSSSVVTAGESNVDSDETESIGSDEGGEGANKSALENIQDVISKAVSSDVGNAAQDAISQLVSGRGKGKSAKKSRGSGRNVLESIASASASLGLGGDADGQSGEGEDEGGSDKYDSDDDDMDKKLKKFDSELRDDYLAKFHPECMMQNYDEIYNLARVVRDDRGIIVDELHKSLPILTKYERTRVLGQRAKQINDGAMPFIKVPEGVIDGYLIALKELEEKKIPFIIRRPLPNRGSEYWHLEDLQIIN